MRHRNKKAILNKPADQRKAMLRNLVTSLFINKKIKTTHAKAKALSSKIEKLITRVKKKEDFNAIRDLMQVVFTKEASQSALTYVKGSEKTSGYTRITKLGQRAGDGAQISQIELI